MLDGLPVSERPMFHRVFGDTWNQLPAVFKKHYHHRPFSQDKNKVDGTLDIKSSWILKLLSPLIWRMQWIPPATGENMSASVSFESDPTTSDLTFNRRITLCCGREYRFTSKMRQLDGNKVVEVFKYGLGWVSSFKLIGDTVELTHEKYVLNIFGLYLPIPLALIVGKGYVLESPVDQNSFNLAVSIVHPLWGFTYRYKGIFTFEDNPEA